MYHYFTCGSNIRSVIELPDLVAINACEIDLTIVRENLQPPALEPVDCWRLGRRAFYGHDEKRDFLHWDGIGDFAAEGGTKLFFSQKTDDFPLFRLYLLNEALGIALFQRGLFLLHASAVEVNGEGIVFMGTPGAGKSTTAAACAKQGYRILADDMVVIKTDHPEGPVLFPALTDVKVWNTSVNGLFLDQKNLKPLIAGSRKKVLKQPKLEYEFKKAIPLSHIISINPGNEHINLQAMDPVEAFLALTQYFPLPPQLLKGKQLQRHFSQASTIIKDAKIWQLNRTDNFADLIHFTQNINDFISG